MNPRRKASISSRNLVDAVLRVERMSFTERERLADEVHARQPNPFYYALKRDAPESDPNRGRPKLITRPVVQAHVALATGRDLALDPLPRAAIRAGDSSPLRVATLTCTRW